MSPLEVSWKRKNRQSSLIHRETIQLALLIGFAVGAFFLTNVVAKSDRDLSVRNAAEWYQQGGQLIAAGRYDDAIDAYRRATVRNRTNATYQLALARALAAKHDDAAARSVLLSLREKAPEDPAINLDLARVAAARHDAAEAVRFYHDALYAPWPAERVAARRAARLELVRFLLANHQIDRAESELVAAAIDAPDDPLHRAELGRLFAQAGDDRHALEQFQRVIRLVPNNHEAQLGAAQAAFNLAQYALARRYLDAVPEDMAGAAYLRDVVDLVISRDPMGTRLGSGERRRRLEADVSYILERSAACTDRRIEPAPPDEAVPARELQALGQQLEQHAALDQDAIETALDLIGRLETWASAACGPPSTLDQALLLIVREHGTASR